MSFKLVKKVIHSDRVDGIQKLVLIILADYVNDSKGGASWPSLQTVALQAGASSRHTRRIIRELEAQGVLKTIRQAGIRGTNKYIIDVDKAVDNIEQSVSDVPRRADIYDIRGGHLRHIGEDTHVRRTDKEQIRTNKLGDAAASGRADVASQQITTRSNSNAVDLADAADAPECQEHTQTDTRCSICYTHAKQRYLRREQEREHNQSA